MGSTEGGGRVTKEIPHVTVLCGGSSPEREVSISSGKNVHGSLVNLGIDSELFLWDGRIGSLNGIKSICFVALHGSPGEDGVVQRYFESRNVIYTGSDSKSCELAHDKIEMKRIFSEVDAETPKVMEKPDRFPCIFKPKTGGSSIGVRLCFSRKDCYDVSENGNFYEDYIDGREITVSVVDIDGLPTVLPVLEIIPKGKFYDYESKYAEGGASLIAPAPLTKGEFKAIRNAALNVYRELNCRDLARIDGIISNGKIYFLEVNPIPGMTPTSDLPASALAMGLSLDDVVLSVIRAAVRRWAN